MLNKILIAVSALLLIGFAFLFAQVQSLQKGRTPDTVQFEDEVAAGISLEGPIRIAYINIDSLNAKYDYIKDMTVELEKEQARMERNMQSRMNQAEARYGVLMEKARTMTQFEMEEAQKELQSLERDIQQFQEKLAIDFRKKEAEVQKKLMENVDNYLQDFNKAAGYDFILSYGAGGQILLANDTLDITSQIVRGLNRLYITEGSANKGQSKN